MTSALSRLPSIPLIRAVPLLGVALALTAGLLATTSQPVQAQDTFEVNLASDGVGQSPGDHDPTDGRCDADASQSGDQCTLRAALNQADEDSDRDIVDFSQIPTTGGFASISVVEEIEVTEEVHIDGSTAPDYPSPSGGPIVKLDGSSISDSKDDGLQLSKQPNATPAGSDITGLAITNFPDDGINVTSADVRVEGCYIGIDVDGKTVEANNTNPDDLANGGIVLVRDGHDISNNVISGNQENGIVIGNGDGAVDPNLSNNNVVTSNTIGLVADGNMAAGNGGAGIHIEDGTSNLIGDFVTDPQPFVFDNTISGNSGAGILVESDGNTVITNEIGTTPDGSEARPNSTGIVLFGNNNTVGGSNASLSANVISGNDFNGVRLGIGGQTSADNNVVLNNQIGTNTDGTSPVPNGNGCVEGGIRFDRGSDNTVTENVIAGNNAHGIFVRGDSYRNAITSNHIGTNANAEALGNNCDGVQISTDAGIFSNENEIHDDNVIGHNEGHGIDLNGSYGKVTNNFVGTNDDGADLGNVGDGVNVSGDFALVGRSSDLSEGGNVIGFNGADGIDLNGTSNTLILGNYVGTNESDADLGNDDVGIEVRETNSAAATDNKLGYDASDSFSDPLPSNGGNGNVVAYNGGPGITIVGEASTGNTTRGNSVYQNGSIGLDLGNDGVTSNDNDDDDRDSGPNNLQNFPIIEEVVHDESSDEVTITYRIQTTTGNADYPLKVDFYAADSESSGEGKIYLDTQEYQSGDATTEKVNIIDLGQFSNVTKEDYFVATVTDASDNTSEFLSPPDQLPVELASIEGTQTGSEAVELTWTTASEKNNAGFEVQRRNVQSADAETTSGSGTWEKVGFVESKADGGTTNEANTYRFTAEELEVGTHQFRLKQQDLDGTTNLHDPVTVELRMQEAVRLDVPAPNPVQNQAALSFAVREEAEAILTLYNVLGQEVRTVYKGTPAPGEAQKTHLDASSLSSGMYMLRLEADGTVKTQKLMVVQ